MPCATPRSLKVTKLLGTANQMTMTTAAAAEGAGGAACCLQIGPTTHEKRPKRQPARSYLRSPSSSSPTFVSRWLPVHVTAINANDKSAQSLHLLGKWKDTKHAHRVCPAQKSQKSIKLANDVAALLVLLVLVPFPLIPCPPLPLFIPLKREGLWVLTGRKK